MYCTHKFTLNSRRIWRKWKSFFPQEQGKLSVITRCPYLLLSGVLKAALDCTCCVTDTKLKRQTATATRESSDIHTNTL